jgi:hypothetical protein
MAWRVRLADQPAAIFDERLEIEHRPLLIAAAAWPGPMVTPPAGSRREIAEAGVTAW